MTNQHDRIAAGTGERPAPDRPAIQDEVQVWCASLDRWVDGFDLVDRTGDGFLVRRLSDGEVLPLAFSEHHVRPRAAAGTFTGNPSRAGGRPG